MAAIVHPRERHLSKVAYLLQLRAVVRGDAEKALPPAPDAVMAPVGAATLHFRDPREQLYVGVGEREKGIEVAPVKGLFHS
jgi:hypothetical protein